MTLTAQQARDQLDAHMREIVQWHFDPANGTPFWLEKAKTLGFDPRWVIKLIKKGWTEHLKAYQEHVIDQAMTVLSANHEIKCMFTTPKLLDALAGRLEKEGSSIRQAGITGVFCGGTEMTAQWMRFAIDELLGPNVYIA